jgi:FAD/FMN-containing dehydrogenase
VATAAAQTSAQSTRGEIVSQATAHTSIASPGRVAPVTALQALRRQVKGAVIEPGRAGWDAATQATKSDRPAGAGARALPADEQDVIAIVEFARAQGMQVTAQRTGHNAEPLGALDDVVLVKTDALQGWRST